MSFDRKANPWLSDFEFFDPSYYKRIMQTNDIWRMDYALARVFNNPAYSETLLQDMHGQIETNKLNKLPIITKEYEVKVSHACSINIIVADIFHIICEKEYEQSEHDLVIKGFAWFLLSTQLFTSISIELPEEVEEQIDKLTDMLNPQYTNILFFHLIELCGTRWAAEKARKLIQDIIKEVS